MRTRSLRATFLAGTLAIVVPVVAAFAAFVFARARGATEEAQRDALRIRAKAVAGLIEIDLDAGTFEIDSSLPEMSEFARPSSGAYFSICDKGGAEIARSPSLGEEALPRPSVSDDAPYPRYGRLASGPFGQPCAVGEYAFRAMSESEREEEEKKASDADDADRAASLSGADSLYLVRVALDSRAGEAALASLLTFLATAGLLALAVALCGAAFLSHRLVVPIRRMTEAAGRMGPGETRERLEPSTVVRELESLATTLNAAFDGLTEAVRRQKRFTADAGHELRTPVTVLLGNAELLLRRDRGAQDYRDGLAVQLRAARRMARIVDGLLFLARADAGHEEIERRQVNLSEVVRSVCADWEPLARDAEISLSSDDRSEVRVQGDANRLRQVADNLISNAVKYTPRGGSVRWETAIEDGCGVLRVSNTGKGIAPEQLKHVFERFYRGDARPEGHLAKSPGAGLGLAIVDGIVRAHGGTAVAESREGEGATFTVRLPLAPATAAVDEAKALAS